MTKPTRSPRLITLLLLVGLAISAAYAQQPAAPGESRSDGKSEEPPPVEWLPWSDEVFERSRQETRGVLLSIVSKWCKPCLRMDQESWSDREVRRWVNLAWIPVRVDADERPDINYRYQLAVASLTSGRTGLPVTAYLFPTGEAMWADLQTAPTDHEKKVGLRRLLPKMADFWLSRFDEAKQNAMAVQRRFDAQGAPRHRGRPDAGLISAIVDGTIGRNDRRYDGYGPPPRSLNHLASRLVLLAASRRQDEGLREQAIRALRAGIEGSVFDHLEGGFHGGIVDPPWYVPIFGKSTMTNASYLLALADGVRVSGDQDLSEAADKTIDYVLSTLALPGHAGFHYGQAPNVDPMMDAAYYTWTVEEVKAGLSEEDQKWASLLFGLEDGGEPMLGLPPRFTLKRVRSPREAAEEAGAEEAAATEARTRIIARLRSLRESRTPPPVSGVAYVDGTALMSGALIHAGAVLGRDDAVGAALAALDAILKARPDLEKGVPHRIDAEEAVDSPLLMLDLALLGNALVDAYEISGEERYLEAARKAATGLLKLYLDEEGGGFFDVVEQEIAPGYLRIRQKFVSDLASPSPQGVAVDLLDRVGLLTGDEEIRRGIEPTLAWAAPRTAFMDERCAGFALALETVLRGRVLISVSSAAEGGDALVRAIWKLHEPGRVLKHVEGASGEPASATACIGSLCREGITEPEALAAEIEGLRARALLGKGSVAAP